LLLLRYHHLAPLGREHTRGRLVHVGEEDTLHATKQQPDPLALGALRGNPFWKRRRAKTDRREQLLHRSQALLHRFGIGPDDAPNGAFVPEATHRPLHTNAYFRALNARLRTAQSHGEAVAILRDIADEIVNGTFP